MVILPITAEQDVNQHSGTAALARMRMEMGHVALRSAIRNVLPGNVALLPAIVGQRRTTVKILAASMDSANATQTTRLQDPQRSMTPDRCSEKSPMTMIYMTAWQTMSWP